MSLPIKLYAAAESRAKLAFHQIHEPTGKRVHQEKVVPGVGPVDAEEIVGQSLPAASPSSGQAPRTAELTLIKAQSLALVHKRDQREDQDSANWKTWRVAE